MSKDQSDARDNVSIDQKLVEEGTIQLRNEIELLEVWLRALEASDENDVEVIAARKS